MENDSKRTIRIALNGSIIVHVKQVNTEEIARENISRILKSKGIAFSKIIEDMEDIGYFIYSTINYESDPILYCQVYAREDGKTEYNFRHDYDGTDIFSIECDTDKLLNS